MGAAVLPASFLPWACIGAALLATLALAARFTPGDWWRRPNARALAVLVLGTCAIGGALWWIAAPRADATGTVASSLQQKAEQKVQQSAPLAGRGYRVADALNLRASTGIGARRVAVLPAGSVVTASGVADGDWWQVRTRVDGRSVEGWASSLWLRRVDEERGEGR